MGLVEGDAALTLLSWRLQQLREKVFMLVLPNLTVRKSSFVSTAGREDGGEKKTHVLWACGTICPLSGLKVERTQ